MMIKCQKCGFENQMGSIFCRECGEKLDMDAIDPNKLQKDVDKEKLIKRTKKRIKGAISAAISLIVVVGFVFVVFPDLFPFGNMRQYEESETTEASANQKYSAAINGTSVGKVKYSYPEINRMLKSKVVDPLGEEESFAKVTGFELAYDEEKNQSIAYVWISIKEKVPVLYTIRGDFNFVPQAPDAEEAPEMPFDLKVKRLDIGRLPLFVSTHTFLNGFRTLLDNDSMHNFFQRAKSVEFSEDGMTVEFAKGGPVSAATPNLSAAPSSNRPSSATAAAALKGGSTAASEKAEAARQKAAEEKAKQDQLAEERKRKAEEYKQQQKEKEEERKRKAEEEKERRKQEQEERRRQQEEENERRRQERENRRNNNYNNNNYGNSRSSRNNRNSRNNRW